MNTPKPRTSEPAVVPASLDGEHIDVVPAAVHAELSAYLASRRSEVEEIGAPVAAAIEHLETFVLGGGKRIRPLYAWAGFVGAHGLTESSEAPQAVLRAASSLEFIQACALIHDDIVDASDTRRGRATVHRVVERQHRDAAWAGHSADYGEHVAILVGDMALVWAEDMFQDSGLTPAALHRSRDAWRAMRTEVIGGQLLDISLEASRSESIALSTAVNRYKTAAYTIERPLHLGASIAGAPAHVIDAFRGYGRDIGIAFQLRDDQLGVFGDPAVTGKPAGDDLREGKRTVLLATALARADEQDRTAAAELRRLIGATQDPSDIARMTQIIAETGAPDEIERRISELTAKGLGYLKQGGIDKSVTDTLHKLAIQVTKRSK